MLFFSDILTEECTDPGHDDLTKQISETWLPLRTDIPQRTVAQLPQLHMHHYKDELGLKTRQLKYDCNVVREHPRPPETKQRVPQQDGDHGHLELSLDILNNVITLRH